MAMFTKWNLAVAIEQLRPLSYMTVCYTAYSKAELVAIYNDYLLRYGKDS